MLPDNAVKRALEGRQFPGRVILVAAGKAAWQMAKTAYACIPIDEGIVITKYGHVMDPIGNLLCWALGYEPTILTDHLDCQAREAGIRLSGLAAENRHKRKTALIAGGETLVVLTGSGKGGRNQELALAAAKGIAGMDNICVFSIGSDGTDGPTDAAGGFVDGNTAPALEAAGISIDEVLKNNDAYHALEKSGGLIFTGPTGTNVNDVAVVLIS